MKNYAKQPSDVSNFGQIFMLGSESHVLLNTELAPYDVRGTPGLIPKIREFGYSRTSIQSLENEIQIE
ncbi:MAG: hypothetical protein L0H53_07765 [Candidatus Nitrosocosmicus sp.]|nr:hypothetical protein [Candidatus Nitrosocosmicus sp.]MDN5867511.1 hypothetical protein [Candidatus Nitrosocosmicus sp.]